MDKPSTPYYISDHSTKPISLASYSFAPGAAVILFEYGLIGTYWKRNFLWLALVVIHKYVFLSWSGVSWMLWASLFLRCKWSRIIIPWRPGWSSAVQRAGRLCAQTLAGGLVICVVPVVAERRDLCIAEESDSDELCLRCALHFGLEPTTCAQ